MLVGFELEWLASIEGELVDGIGQWIIKKTSISNRWFIPACGKQVASASSIFPTSAHPCERGEQHKPLCGHD